MKLSTRASLATAFFVSILIAPSAHADLSAEDLAKIAQNPVANLISVPFQNNTNLNVGPQEHTQNVLNIQPVIPIDLNSDWNIITRTILPIISQPICTESEPHERHRRRAVCGVSVSAKPGSWIWGAGPIIQLPTHSNDLLGNNNAGVGPSFVVLHLTHGDPLGIRGAGQQHLVSRSQQFARLQQWTGAAIRQLQFRGRPLPYVCADLDG